MLHHHHRHLQIRRELRNHRLQRLGATRGTCKRYNLGSRIENRLARRRRRRLSLRPVHNRSRSCTLPACNIPDRYCFWRCRRSRRNRRRSRRQHIQIRHRRQNPQQPLTECPVTAVQRTGRLMDKVQRSQFQRIKRNLCTIRRICACHDNLRRNLTLLQLFQKLQTVHLRHIHVKHYRVIGFSAEQTQRVQTVYSPVLYTESLI